jgi:NADPH2:quinone reductase
VRARVQSATDSTVFAGAAVRFAQVAVAHHTMAAPVPDGVDLRRVTAAIVNGVTAWVPLR